MQRKREVMILTSTAKVLLWTGMLRSGGAGAARTADAGCETLPDREASGRCCDTHHTALGSDS